MSVELFVHRQGGRGILESWASSIVVALIVNARMKEIDVSPTMRGPVYTMDHEVGPWKIRVQETLELNQLKSAPSQLLPVFSRFDRLQTCCHSFGPVNIPFFLLRNTC